jgi:hypothetical protein
MNGKTANRTVVYLFIEPPGSPGQPEPTEITNNTVTLSWDKPASDGGNEEENIDVFHSPFVLGGPITGYWVEKREENSDKWIPVNIAPCQSTHYTVPSLLEDHVYEFRVTAENEAGKGTPSDASKSTRVRLKHGLFHFINEHRYRLGQRSECIDTTGVLEETERCRRQRRQNHSLGSRSDWHAQARH